VRRDSELSALAGRFPHWEAWKGISGLWHARRPGTGDEPVSGESVEDLADQITRAEALAQPAEKPAAQLARIRREYPAWSVRHVAEGFGFAAHCGDRRLWAATLTGLDAKITEAEREAG
jgi:hypothetical protein